MSAPRPTFAPVDTAAGSPRAAGGPGYFDLFAIRDFLRYWISQFVSSIGDRLDQMAVLALILRSQSIEQSDKGGATILIFLFATLPYVVVTPLTAGLTDRVDRRRLMLWTDVYRGIVVAIAAMLYTVDLPVFYYYLCPFLSGCGTAVFGPCKLAFIPQLVPAQGLVKANSISSMTGTLGTLIGTTVGGFFLAWAAGPLLSPENVGAMSRPGIDAYQARATGAARALLVIDAATYVFSAWMLWHISIPRGNLPHWLASRVRDEEGAGRAGDAMSPAILRQVEATSARARQSYFADFVESIRYARTHRLGRAQLALTAVVWLVIGVAYAGLQSRAIDVLHGDEARVAKIFGVLGVSMFAGGLVIGLGQRWFRPRRVLTVAMLLLAAFGTLPVWATHWSHLMFACIPLGVVAGVTIIAIDSVYQLGVPNRLRGRMFASNYIVLNIFLVLGMGVVAAAVKRDAEYFSAAAFFLVSALGAVGALMTWFGAVQYRPR